MKIHTEQEPVKRKTGANDRKQWGGRGLSGDRHTAAGRAAPPGGVCKTKRAGVIRPKKRKKRKTAPSDA